mmetsp:Transcript_38586/g.75780  ORF Transcript_38586/g.75780 Transcript_38586/m.75780 type:complete len:96 (-) Transcript_38586:34-321(-)
MYSGVSSIVYFSHYAPIYRAFTHTEERRESLFLYDSAYLRAETRACCRKVHAHAHASSCLPSLTLTSHLPSHEKNGSNMKKVPGGLKNETKLMNE